ncbi:Uncharacterised protein [Vibrio cholerae]|nr:Uncharacterised protein [Vibrio cholerae]
MCQNAFLPGFFLEFIRCIQAGLREIVICPDVQHFHITWWFKPSQ